MSATPQVTISENGTVSVIKNQFNASPLGLMGFGLTTILLNLLNADILPSTSMSVILSMGLFYGGIAQIVAGVFEAKQDHTFGATVFLSYGFFWLSFFGLNLFPMAGLTPLAPPDAVGIYLALWGVFTAGMSVVTFKKNTALQTIFVSLTILFFLLAASDFTSNAVLRRVAGYEGLFCGASAIYLAFAEIINEVYDREILPIGDKQVKLAK